MAADPEREYSGHTEADEEDMLAQLRGIGVPRDDDASSGRTPSLGEDNFDIRFNTRALGGKHRAWAPEGKQPVPDQESPASGRKLSGSDVLDLNDAEHLARSGLEDPDLLQHMEMARRALQQHEQKQSRLFEVDEIRKQDTSARRALSTLITGVIEQKMGLQCACDEVDLHLTNIGRLQLGTADGKPPHGYPAPCQSADANMNANLGHLHKKLAGTSKSLAKLLEGLTEFERELTLTRRNYEQVVDALHRRAEAPAPKSSS